MMWRYVRGVKRDKQDLDVQAVHRSSSLLLAAERLGVDRAEMGRHRGSAEGAVD